MTKEEKQRAFELQGYINSIRDMTLKDIAIKYLKKYHLPKFLARLLVDFSYPLLLTKDYELAELKKENAELKEKLEKETAQRVYNFNKSIEWKEKHRELKKENESLENVKNIYIGDLLKAKEIIKEYMRFEPMIGTCSFYSEEYEKTKIKAEQFISKVE